MQLSGISPHLLSACAFCLFLLSYCYGIRFGVGLKGRQRNAGAVIFFPPYTSYPYTTSTVPRFSTGSVLYSFFNLYCPFLSPWFSLCPGMIFLHPILATGLMLLLVSTLSFFGIPSILLGTSARFFSLHPHSRTVSPPTPCRRVTIRHHSAVVTLILPCSALPSPSILLFLYILHVPPCSFVGIISRLKRISGLRWIRCLASPPGLSPLAFSSALTSADYFVSPS